MAIAVRAMGVYHIDSVESTSKRFAGNDEARKAYTILTLWSQLQNTCPDVPPAGRSIPY